MVVIKYLFYFFIFPGFLFAASTGLLAGWIDRKVTARIQYRVGPPWYQNFADILKLLGKEIIVPANRGFTFFIAPLIAFFGKKLYTHSNKTLIKNKV